MQFGDSDDLLIGEWVIAIGNPFGFIIDDPRLSVGVGVVSAVDRTVTQVGGKNRVYRGMIQNDATINQGNSGGPLVNALGQVVGINTFIVSTTGSYEVLVWRSRLIVHEGLPKRYFVTGELEKSGGDFVSKRSARRSRGVLGFKQNRGFLWRQLSGIARQPAPDWNRAT